MDNKINDTVDESYWQDVEDKDYSEINLKEEFSEGTYQIGLTKKSRRDFLKIMGFSLSVLPMATSCKKISAQKAIPYLHKNDQVTPGVANWYATTSSLCPSHCSLLVKTREGRPIKIEGNPLSPVTKGGTCPVCQASVLSLYDSSRFKAPKKNGQYTTFEAIDAEIRAALLKAASEGKRTALVMNSIYGPSLLNVVTDFKNSFGNVDVIIYNPFGESATVRANALSFGREDTFAYKLSDAKLIVGISSDFLATGTDPVHLTKEYSARKDLFTNKNPIRHIQVESVMTLTGSNADSRIVLSHDDESTFINNLLFFVQKSAGSNLLPVKEVAFDLNSEVQSVAAELLKAQGESLVLSGSFDIHDQIKVNAINFILGNFNKTITLSSREYNRYENDADFIKFLTDAEAGKYANVIFYDVNPFYDFFDTSRLEQALKKIETKVSLATAPDETSEHSNYVAPDRHYLEKWDDFETARGVFAFSQPVIQSLFNNRSAQESLLVWMGNNSSYEDYIKNLWQNKLLKQLGQTGSFATFWNKALHDGVFVATSNSTKTPAFNFAAKLPEKKPASGSLKLKVYEKNSMRKGKFANNPWLQEMPDPITKATWDNYLMVSPKLAKSKNITTGDLVRIKASGKELTLPALIQPGVHETVVAVALGYGRTVSGRAGKGVGVNAYPFTTFEGGSFQSGVAVDSLEKTGKTYKLALTQTHHSLEGRDIVRETTLGNYIVDPSAGNPSGVKLVSMWKDHKKEGHQWAMMIDLSKCTGCSGCVISCNAENNVPVVGKEEVYNRREMHWMRLDRYYKGDEQNPEVVHQPMLCAHCDNAPCETVCPVLATVQSSDGLNQQVYNRCVGTRYCANNCPYKVRRFNWFDYAHDDKLENMVLNPDITVRTRGVMEKCSMCIQRIQEGKLQAKKEGRPLKDGEIKLACQQSCPADAIVFGDINDPESEISKKLKDPRYYRVLEELGVAPRVGYLTKVRNK